MRGPRLGYKPLSAAMVDIRATVARAVEAGTCLPDKADRIVRAAKARHFSERTWPWGLEQRRLKTEDARAMLERMRDDLAAGVPLPPPPLWEPTDFWVEAWERDIGKEAM